MCRKRKVVPGRATGGSSEEGGGEVETTKSSIRTERRWTVRVQINAGTRSFFLCYCGVLGVAVSKVVVR